jgi:hypothetical protein
MLTRRSFLFAVAAGASAVRAADERPEAAWIVLPAQRSVDACRLGAVLADIEGHLPLTHPYRDTDPLTWAHEGTHGVNSLIRNSYRGRFNGFYFPFNRALVVEEPPLQLSRVGRYVPGSLRGQNYQQHLYQSLPDWNDRPLYLFDEWTAYGNSSQSALECVVPIGARIRFTLESAVYCTTLVAVVAGEIPSYDGRQLYGTLRWSWRRTMSLLRGLRGYAITRDAVTEDYLHRLQTATDAAWMRTFLRDALGAALAQEVLET